MGWFKYEIISQISKTEFLRKFWRKALSYKTRFHILQSFSLLSNTLNEYSETLIALLEEPGSYDFDKKEEVLKFLKKNKFGILSPEFPKIWLQKVSASNSVFNFNGAFLPYNKELDVETLSFVFLDTFLFSLFFNDDYSAAFVERLDKVMIEGPYGYTADDFDVTVKRGDIVIDAGAWIGDFSAYTAAKGASAYAFEPSAKTFRLLQKTAELNTIEGGGGGFTL